MLYEVITYAFRIEHFDRGDLLRDDGAERAQPLVAKLLIREHHIIGGERRAVGKRDAVAQGEDHPVL